MTFFELPTGPEIPLDVAPRLASWMARGHPDQVRLIKFLDHAESVVGPSLESAKGPLALRLDVGLPSEVDLLKHHDLDNYAFPLAARLGAHRFASIWTTKRYAEASLIRVDTARPAQMSAGDIVRIKTQCSAETSAWKEEVRAQLTGVQELTEGPVELQATYRVGSSRNWANLWKPTIDALEPLLGSTGRRWNPRDGRIVRLGLHREVDASLQYDVEIELFSRPVGDAGRW